MEFQKQDENVFIHGYRYEGELKKFRAGVSSFFIKGWDVSTPLHSVAYIVVFCICFLTVFEEILQSAIIRRNG